MGCWRSIVRPRLLPEPERHWNRVHVEPAPPCRLVTGAMQLTVMHPADRDDEFVAYPTSECARLCEGEVMRVRWYAAAYEACLPQHESSVVLIAQANRFAQRLD